MGKIELFRQKINLSNKEKLIKIYNFLGGKGNACDDIPKSGWNMENLDTERISLI